MSDAADARRLLSHCCIGSDAARPESTSIRAEAFAGGFAHGFAPVRVV
jgi:hypothetical protein